MRSITCAPVAGSRLPVGSSANSSARPRHEGARDRDALLLAAGELLGIVLEALAEPDALEHAPARPRSRVAAPASSSGSITFSSAVIAGSSWNDWNTKPTMRAAQRRAPVFVEREEIVAVDAHAPVGRRVEPREQAEQRRLARARDADDRHRLAGADLETYVVEDGQSGVAGANLSCRVASAWMMRLVGLFSHRAFASRFASPARCAAVAPLAAPPAATILVFGDSLSAGYGLPQDKGWASLLADAPARRRLRL